MEPPHDSSNKCGRRSEACGTPQAPAHRVGAHRASRDLFSPTPRWRPGPRLFTSGPCCFAIR
eukprot:2183477-Pyramimonas_sp.AAC.1